MKSSLTLRGAMLLLAPLFVAACSTSEVTAPMPEFQTSLERSTTHVFVLTEEDEPSDELLAEIDRRGGAVLRSFDAFGVLTVRGLLDEDASELASRRDIDGIDRDLMIQWTPSFDETIEQTIEGPDSESDQSGAFYFARGMQWNMTQIDADDAWLASGQGAGTVVAVLDGGVDPFHIDLAGKVTASSVSVLTPGTSPCGPFDETTFFDLNFHGTFVAGLIASNGLAMGSVAPDASIMGVKVLNCGGSGSFADIIAGIEYAASSGADVINMSLGAYFSKKAPGAKSLIKALKRAVNYADRRGTLVVASAGNDGINLDEDGDFIHVPSEINKVVSVGATAPIAQMDFDMLASYTNYGRSGVDLMAPGGDLTPEGICGFAPIYRCDLVLSAFTSFVAPGTNWYILSAGTSFAAPHVAGAGAVVLSSGVIEDDEDDGDERTEELRECLIEGADDLGKRGRDVMYSHGRLNVVGAVACDDDDDDDDEG